MPSVGAVLQRATDSLLRTRPVFHLLSRILNRELYGLNISAPYNFCPGEQQSVTLSAEAGYSRAHAGYIMYVTDAAQDRNDISIALQAKHGWCRKRRVPTLKIQPLFPSRKADAHYPLAQ